jgi:hypothetical protein
MACSLSRPAAGASAGSRRGCVPASAESRRPVGTCPGRKPPFFVFKRPARPYKAPYKMYIHRETLRNAKGAKPPREDADSCSMR